MGDEMMDGLAIILFLLIALWSITKTLEKLAHKIMKKQDKKNELLEELISSLKDKSN
jgi:ABC-type bacteriocin/lantibiotic exporter with double-glycine peptidase domain